MPDYKVHCEECGGFINIRGVGSCHCSTEHKLNDEPKISPSVMKAAGVLYRDYVDTFIHDEEYVCKMEITQIIENATHLSAKEAALRGLMETIDWDWLLRILNDETRTRPGRETLRLIRAVLAKAKEALKP